MQFLPALAFSLISQHHSSSHQVPKPRECDLLEVFGVGEEVIACWLPKKPDKYTGDWSGATIVAVHPDPNGEYEYRYDVTFFGTKLNCLDACFVVSVDEYEEHFVPRTRVGTSRLRYDNRRWTTDLTGSHVFSSLLTAITTYDELKLAELGEKVKKRNLNIADDFDWGDRGGDVPKRVNGNERIQKEVVAMYRPRLNGGMGAVVGGDEGGGVGGDNDAAVEAIDKKEERAAKKAKLMQQLAKLEAEEEDGSDV